MLRKKVILIQAFALICFIYSCHSENKEKKSPGSSKPVSFIEGFVVKTDVIDQTISVSGTLKPFEETVLMPDISGRIVKINFSEGAFVKQGTLLFRLFDEDLQAQLQKSIAQLKIAEQTMNRQSELVKVEGISQSDYDQTVLQVNSIKGDIGVLHAQIRKAEIIAPFDGVIGLRNVSLGTIVNPATPLATIRQVSQLKLDFNVPGKYSVIIKPGMKFNFSVQGADKKFEAIVIASERGIDPNTGNLKARAIVDANNPILVPGAFTNIDLKVRENKNALMIPTQAIIPQELNKKVIISQNGKAVFVTVKTGVRLSTKIEVLSGIEVGDTVVTTGILFIKPGAELKFKKVIN